jgi:hypothetical protein
MMRAVARVLICEPHPEVRELLSRIVVRLGHDPVLDDAELGPVDAILLEPAHAPSVERAAAFKSVDEQIPVVCATTSRFSKERSSQSAVSQSPASRGKRRHRWRSYNTARYFSISHGVSWTR